MMTILLILGAVIFMSLFSSSRYDDYDRYDRRRRPARTVVYNDDYDEDWRYRQYRAEESKHALMYAFIFVGIIAFLMFGYNEINPVDVEQEQTRTSQRITQSR